MVKQVSNKLNKFTGMLTEYMKIVEADSPALQKFGKGIDSAAIAAITDLYTRQGHSPDAIFNFLTQNLKKPVADVAKVFNNLKLPVPNSASSQITQQQVSPKTGTTMPTQQPLNTNPTNQVTSQANTVTTQPTTARPQATSNNTSNYSSFKRAFDAEPKLSSLLTQYFNEPNEESLIKKLHTLPAEYQDIILRHTQTQAPWDQQKFIELIQSGKLAAYRQSTQTTQAQSTTKPTAQTTQAQSTTKPTAQTTQAQSTKQPVNQSTGQSLSANTNNVSNQAIAKAREIYQLYATNGLKLPAGVESQLAEIIRKIQSQSTQPIKENQEFQRIINLAGLK